MLGSTINQDHELVIVPLFSVLDTSLDTSFSSQMVIIHWALGSQTIRCSLFGTVQI